MKKFLASFNTLVWFLNVLLVSESQVSATMPGDFSSLALWMQGDNFSDGTDVWSDSSSFARNTIGGTASDGPLKNSHKAVHFSGADALIVPAFAMEPSMDGTCFIVFGNVANGAGTLFSKFNNGSFAGWDYHINADGNTPQLTGRIGSTLGTDFLTAADPTNPTGPNTFHISSMTYNGTSSTPRADLRLDGVLTTDNTIVGTRSPDLPLNPVTIGGLGFPAGDAERKLTGDIWEIIFFSEALNDENRQGIEQYLQNKYNPIAIPGDLNGDGFVGQDDLNIVLGDWGSMQPGDPRADPSGDGFVGQDDLNPVLAHWGQGILPLTLSGSSWSAAAVPEPSSLALAMLAFGMMCRCRKRSRECR